MLHLLKLLQDAYNVGPDAYNGLLFLFSKIRPGGGWSTIFLKAVAAVAMMVAASSWQKFDWFAVAGKWAISHD